MARDHLNGNIETLERKTKPMPTTCDLCGFELPKDAEKNRGYFVNRMICRDSARKNKAIVGVPSEFLKSATKDGCYKIKGDSTGGYVLKDNFTFVRWIVWCESCHSEKVRMQNLHLKSNQIDVTKNKSPEAAIAMMKSLVRKQNMRIASKPR